MDAPPRVRSSASWWESWEGVCAALKLYAWIGEDEFGSGEVGIKQARVPAGFIPMVATRRDKVDRPEIRHALQRQAEAYGVTIRLVSFTLDDGPPLVQLPPES